MTFRPSDYFFLTCAAFLNETGLSFVKKCIELIETRGTCTSRRCCKNPEVSQWFIKTFFLCPCEGLTTPGLYRTGGVNSKVQRLMTTVFGKWSQQGYFLIFRGFRCCRNIRTPKLQLSCDFPLCLSVHSVAWRPAGPQCLGQQDHHQRPERLFQVMCIFLHWHILFFPTVNVNISILCPGVWRNLCWPTGCIRNSSGLQVSSSHSHFGHIYTDSPYHGTVCGHLQ